MSSTTCRTTGRKRSTHAAAFTRRARHWRLGRPGSSGAGAALRSAQDLRPRLPGLHADETPVALLDPGAGKTRRACVWAYARSWHDAVPGVVYEFCLARGAQYPQAFLAGDARQGRCRWSGTLLSDRYVGDDSVCDPRIHPDRFSAACVAHARRKFDELARAGMSPIGDEAIRRYARIYAVEAELKGMSDDERKTQRQQLAKPLWDKLKPWLELARRRVVDGGAAARAIDYTLGHWTALTRYIEDGAVAIDNNHLERQIKPWAMGRRAWLFAGSELAGQRAAMVMSLVQSARLTGTTRGRTCATCWRACPHSSTARSRNCCRIGGSRARPAERPASSRSNVGRLTTQMVVRAAIDVEELDHDGKVRLADEIFAAQPDLLGSILVLARMGVSMPQVEIGVHILLVAFQAMKRSRHRWDSGARGGLQ